MKSLTEKWKLRKMIIKKRNKLKKEQEHSKKYNRVKTIKISVEPQELNC